MKGFQGSSRDLKECLGRLREGSRNFFKGGRGSIDTDFSVLFSNFNFKDESRTFSHLSVM